MGRYRILALLLMLALTGCSFEPDGPLPIAAAAGETDEVSALLAAGESCEARDGRGMTPLAWAARRGHPETVTALLEAGCDPERPAGNNGWTPLVHAVHKGQGATVRALLEGGAAADGVGGRRALLMAAGYGVAAMVRELLARGADPTAVPNLLRDAVGGASDIDHHWQGCEGPTETVKILLAAAPRLELGDGFRERHALDYARRKGCDELVSLVAPRP